MSGGGQGGHSWGTLAALAHRMGPPAMRDGPLFTRRIGRALLMATLVGAVVFVVGWAYEVLLTIFAGVIFGVLLEGLARKLAAHARLAYRLALSAVVLALAALVTLGVWLVGPALASQLEQLAVQIPKSAAQLIATMRSLPFGAMFTGQTPRLAPIAGAAVNVAWMGFETVAGIVVALVIGIYLAVDPKAYLHGLLRLVPIPSRARAGVVVERTTSALFSWLIGQMLLMVVVGVVTAVGLWIAGVPLAFALGILAGAMTYIPYLGVVLSMVPALLVALTVAPMKMLWVLVVFAIAHGLEGYVLSPAIAKHTVHFPPAFTVGVQILLGTVWGVLGFAFATPMAIVVTSLVRMLYVEDVLGDRAEEKR